MLSVILTDSVLFPEATNETVILFILGGGTILGVLVTVASLLVRRKQTKTALKKRMREIQAEIDRIEVEGQSGGGAVRVILSANRQPRGLVIDKQLKGLAIEDQHPGTEQKAMLEDLIAAAREDARRKAERSMENIMKCAVGHSEPSYSSNWRMPPLHKLPPARLSLAARSWMLVLRAYLVLAAGLILFRIVVLAIGEA
jgi:nucleoid-associated protein EbfC